MQLRVAALLRCGWAARRDRPHAPRWPIRGHRFRREVPGGLIVGEHARHGEALESADGQDRAARGDRGTAAGGESARTGERPDGKTQAGADEQREGGPERAPCDPEHRRFEHDQPGQVALRPTGRAQRHEFGRPLAQVHEQHVGERDSGEGDDQAGGREVEAAHLQRDRVPEQRPNQRASERGLHGDEKRERCDSRGKPEQHYERPRRQAPQVEESEPRESADLGTRPLRAAAGRSASTGRMRAARAAGSRPAAAASGFSLGPHRRRPASQLVGARGRRLGLTRGRESRADRPP